MELEDIEVGMIIKDNFDNWYKITGISHKENDRQLVKLLCIFNSNNQNYFSRMDGHSFEFKINSEWWITRSEMKDFSIV